MSSEISQAQSVSRKLLLARLAWAIIVLLCFVVVVVSEYVSLQNGSQEWLVITSYQALAHLLSFKAYLAYLLLVRHLILFLFIAVALLVLWRRTEDWMALLVSITLVLLPVTFFFSNISQNSLVPAPWDVIFSNLEALLTMTAIGCLLVLFSSFPDGVFKPAWLFPFMSAAFVLILIFFRLSASNENYWLAAVLTFALMLLVGVIGQIYRYRKNTSVIYRQQMKWVLLAFFFMAVTFPNIILFSLIIKDESLLNLISLHVQFLVYPLIPLSFAVAILRYRLWDIDVIIRRTLVYAVLTFSLALVYFVMVILLERVLR
ncbi:MAG TPA: hypothetical protein VLA49_00900, partial [Anaerolineales bacterium]|nr:hypothetical protein [Anaerolineales bacterium]